jgi:hypothetical protein
MPIQRWALHDFELPVGRANRTELIADGKTRYCRFFLGECIKFKGSALLFVIPQTSCKNFLQYFGKR